VLDTGLQRFVQLCERCAVLLAQCQQAVGDINMLGDIKMLAHFQLFSLQALQLVLRSLAIRLLDALPIGLDGENQFLGESLENRDLTKLVGTLGEPVQRQPGRNGNQGGKSQHKGKTDGQLASDLDMGEERKCATVIHVCGCSKQVNKRAIPLRWSCCWLPQHSEWRSLM